jgi:hypothetical protein
MAFQGAMIRGDAKSEPETPGRENLNLQRTKPTEQQSNMNKPSTLVSFTRRVIAMCAAVSLCLAGVADAKPNHHAPPNHHQPSSDITLTPSITDVSVEDGDVVVSGEVKAKLRGRTVTSEFDDIRLSIEIAEDQTGAGDCPILEITLDPISVDLLGLSVETGRVCIRINNYDDVEDISESLCDLSDELEGGATLDEILEGTVLSEDEIDQLTSALSDLLESAHAALGEATVVDIETKKGRTAAEISLELEPTDLDLLGIDADIDDCEGGPVTIDISVKRGGQLGNVISRALRKGDIEEGATLEELLEELNDSLKH